MVIVLKVLCYIDVGESNQATDDGGEGGQLKTSQSQKLMEKVLFWELISYEMVQH